MVEIKMNNEINIEINIEIVKNEKIIDASGNFPARAIMLKFKNLYLVDLISIDLEPTYSAINQTASSKYSSDYNIALHDYNELIRVYTGVNYV